MTQYTRGDLEMADRHIARGGEIIARQEEILASFRLQGSPILGAEQLLALFIETQAAHREHRDLIAAALEEVKPPLRLGQIVRPRLS